MKKQLMINKQMMDVTFEEVIQMFKPLCVKFTNRTYVEGYENEDLMQVAYMALFRAYKNYDASKGIEFNTLAYRYVQMDMTRLIRDSFLQKRDTQEISFVDLHSTLGGSSEAQTYLETIPDKQQSIEEQIINSQLMNIIANSITEDEKLLIPVLMGHKTQLQYSKEVGISNEGARKRANKLALKLRSKLQHMG